MLTIRLRGPAGVSTLQFDSPLDTLASLQQKVSSTAGVPIPRQELRVGFPPKLIPTTDSTASLESLGIKNGEMIILTVASEDTAYTPSRVPASPSQAPNSGTDPRSLSDAQSASSLVNKAKSREIQSVETDGGFLVLRVVPDDNSCLFTAVAILLEQGRKDSVPYLRNLVASSIRSKPEIYSAAVLGQSAESYITTITGKNAWGGAIELAIFAAHYKLEICSIDVKSGRIDKFGQGEGFDTRILLVYSGIHYDALSFSYSKPEYSTSFPPDLSFDTTIFTSASDEILAAALKLVAKLRATHSYTDAATFTLKCEQCGAALVGETEARKHAELTSHTNFGEYDG